MMNGEELPLNYEIRENEISMYWVDDTLFLKLARFDSLYGE